MSHRSLGLGLAGLIALAVVGGMASGLSVSDADAAVTPGMGGVEAAPSAEGAAADDAEALRTRLLSLRLFPVAEKEALAPETVVSGEAGEEELVIPPLPLALAASVVDGQAEAYLSVDGEIIAVRRGDMLPSGWEVESADLDAVDLRFGPVQRTLDIASAVDIAPNRRPRRR
ncbi:MAG: hypothetical protein WBG08_05530 [Litorimonas sp.]